jgi:hypothetical protein
VAENTNSWQGQTAELQKCFINVADLSQNTEFLFCFCFVSLVWTRLNGHTSADEMQGCSSKRLGNNNNNNNNTFTLHTWLIKAIAFYNL